MIKTREWLIISAAGTNIKPNIRALFSSYVIFHTHVGQSLVKWGRFLLNPLASKGDIPGRASSPCLYVCGG